MNQDQVKKLCDAAQRAWNAAKGRAKRVEFEHDGKRYVSKLTTFRMLVDDAKTGEPVAYRCH